MDETTEKAARLTKANCTLSSDAASTHMRGLLQGEPQQCNHYIDGTCPPHAELDRFTRGFADQDKR